MATSANTNTLALRGLVIGSIILGLCIAVFAVVSKGGHLRTPDFIEDISRMMSSPAPPPPPKKSRSAEADPMHIADPGAGAGLPDGGSPMGGPPPIVTPLSAGPVPKSAAQALHQVLHRYRNDPKHTATVTISSSGRITETAPGPLTAHDGLPVEALDGSTEFGAAAPDGAPAAPAAH